MATASNAVVFQKVRNPLLDEVKWSSSFLQKKKEKDREQHPYNVIEITPPPKNLGIRCFPSNIQCGESVTIEGQAYTVSAVIHRFQLRKGKYEPCDKRLDVQSTGRYILNLLLENLLENS